MLRVPTWVGRTLGKASVELLLAREDGAEVYLGRHRGLQRAVTIKIFTGLSADDPSAFSDFQLDARSLAALQDPHIATVLESGRVDTYPYLVLEYVPGTSLASHLKALSAAERRFDPTKISQLVKDVAAGLDYAHRARGGASGVKTLRHSAYVILHSGRGRQTASFGLSSHPHGFRLDGVKRADAAGPKRHIGGLPVTRASRREPAGSTQRRLLARHHPL